MPDAWDTGKTVCREGKNLSYSFSGRAKTIQYRSRYNYVHRDRCAMLKTSVGCPHDCEFRFRVEIMDRRCFERPLPEGIEEIKTIREGNVFIVDGNFLAPDEERSGPVKKKKLYFMDMACPLPAAMLPPDGECEICLETIENVSFETDTPVIGLGGMGHAARRAVDIAVKLRKRGKP